MELKDILQERNSLKVRNLNISARKAAKQMSKTNPIAFLLIFSCIDKLYYRNSVPKYCLQIGLWQINQWSYARLYKNCISQCSGSDGLINFSCLGFPWNTKANLGLWICTNIGTARKCETSLFFRDGKNWAREFITNSTTSSQYGHFLAVYNSQSMVSTDALPQINNNFLRHESVTWKMNWSCTDRAQSEFGQLILAAGRRG